MGYAFVVVAFAEVPEADLVVVVEAEGAGEGVDEDGVAGCGGDYVGYVYLEEPGVAQDGLVMRVSYYRLFGRVVFSSVELGF